MVEWATSSEQKLDVAKTHLAEIEMALFESLQALEMERKGRSVVDREVKALRRHLLGAEELIARLRERVSEQEARLTVVEAARLGMNSSPILG